MKYGIWTAAALFVLLANPQVSHAALDNQPPLNVEATAQVLAAVQQFTLPGGDVARARPDLLLLIEANPAADFANKIIPALSDHTTYLAVVDVLEEAQAKADAKAKPFVLYNIVRVHEIRAHNLPQGTTRTPFVAAARKAATRFEPSFQDPGLWEVKGDVEADAGDADAANAAYKKMGLVGSGTPAVALYKAAGAYQAAGRFASAEVAYKSAASADTGMSDKGGRQTRHLIYQGLTGLYLERGDYAKAANALAQSAQVKETTPPFSLQVGNAQTLLRRGGNAYAKAVLNYANAALLLTPDDERLTLLRDTASALGGASAPPSAPRRAR